MTCPPGPPRAFEQEAHDADSLKRWRVGVDPAVMVHRGSGSKSQPRIHPARRIPESFAGGAGLCVEAATWGSIAPFQDSYER